MKFTIATLALLITSASFASGAKFYDCVGVNKINQKAIRFNLEFTDYGPGVGFTNQSMSIYEIDGKTVDQLVMFQMAGVKKKNHCQTNADGEILLNSTLANFSMTSSQDSEQEGQTVSFKANCASQKADVVAVCSFGSGD